MNSPEVTSLGSGLRATSISLRGLQQDAFLPFPTEQGLSQPSPPSSAETSSTLRDQGRRRSAGQAGLAAGSSSRCLEEAARLAECFSAAIRSYSRHSRPAPPLLTQPPLRLPVSFSSFLKAAASQESPWIWRSTEGPAPLVLS